MYFGIRVNPNKLKIISRLEKKAAKYSTLGIFVNCFSFLFQCSTSEVCGEISCRCPGIMFILQPRRDVLCCGKYRQCDSNVPFSDWLSRENWRAGKTYGNNQKFGNFYCFKHLILSAINIMQIFCILNLYIKSLNITVKAVYKDHHEKDQKNSLYRDRWSLLTGKFVL